MAFTFLSQEKAGIQEFLNAILDSCFRGMIIKFKTESTWRQLFKGPLVFKAREDSVLVGRPVEMECTAYLPQY